MQVKEAAEQAGRNPDHVKVWSCFATVGDHLPEGIRLKKLIGRMATYLQAYGDLMVKTNDWDPVILNRFREDEFVKNFRGAIDNLASTAELEHVSTLIPEDWLASAATGSVDSCVKSINEQFDMGCDGVILHGASPSQIAPIVEGYRAQRSSSRFVRMTNNPGGVA